MIVLGLTGSVGMGKTTTAAMFRALGIPVHDADAAVHALYRGPLAVAIEAAFPGTVREGEVDRAALGARVFGDADAMARLERLVHPEVRGAQADFLEEAARLGAPAAVLEVPLLFETGADRLVDAVVVATASPEIQRARVLARPGMDEARLATVLARQLPDAQKRARADFVVDTGAGLEPARRQVEAILAALPEIQGTAFRPGLPWPRDE